MELAAPGPRRLRKTWRGALSLRDRIPEKIGAAFLLWIAVVMVGMPTATTRWPRQGAFLYSHHPLPLRIPPTTWLPAAAGSIGRARAEDGIEGGGAKIAVMRLRGGRASILGARLQALQWSMGKDPGGYVNEMQAQKNEWERSVKAWLNAPQAESKETGELAVFLSNMHVHHPALLATFPEQLLGIFGGGVNDTSAAAGMAKETRHKMATALTILCARKGCSTEQLCAKFFSLFSIPDKKLRSYVYSSCVGAIKRANAKSVDQGMNRRIQRTLAAMLHGNDGPSSRLAINMFVEMYRRRMWDDDHAVNLIGEACFSRSNKVRPANPKSCTPNKARVTAIVAVLDGGDDLPRPQTTDRRR